MKEKEIYNKKAKEFFNKIGLEKTSSDFTGAVMNRIQLEHGIEKSKALPGLTYFLIAMLFTSGILILPFGNYIMDFVNNLINVVLDIDYSFIYNIITSIIDTIIEYSTTSTILIVFVFSSILILTLIYINYQDNSYKTAELKIA